MAIPLLLSEILNAKILSKLRVLVQGKYFITRSIGSTMIGNAFYLSIAAVIAFSTRMEAKEIIELIIVTYVMKSIFAVILGFAAKIIVVKLKKIEGISLR